MSEVSIFEEVDSFWRKSVWRSALWHVGKLSILFRNSCEWTISCLEMRAFDIRFHKFIHRLVDILWSREHIWVMRMGRDHTVLVAILRNDNCISCHLCLVSPCLFIWASTDAMCSLLWTRCKSSIVVSLLWQLVCSKRKVGIKMSPGCSSRFLCRLNTKSVGLVCSNRCHWLFTYAEMMWFEVTDQSLNSRNVSLALRWLRAVFKSFRRLFKSTVAGWSDEICLVVHISLLLALFLREILSFHWRMLKFIRSVVADRSFSHTKVALSELLALFITGLRIDWLCIIQFFMDILWISLPYST